MSRTLLRWAAAVAGAAAVIVLLMSPFLTRPQADGVSDLPAMRFGWPVPYVVQDQSHTDPPFPHTASLMSPLEFRTGIDYPRLLAAVLLLFVPAAVLVMGWTKAETRVDERGTSRMSSD